MDGVEVVTTVAVHIPKPAQEAALAAYRAEARNAAGSTPEKCLQAALEAAGPHIASYLTDALIRAFEIKAEAPRALGDEARARGFASCIEHLEHYQAHLRLVLDGKWKAVKN